MSVVKGFALLTCLAMPASAMIATCNTSLAAAPNKAALKAMLEKCSREADAKGLDVKAGKVAARKEFRQGCMRKMGVEPKK